MKKNIRYLILITSLIAVLAGSYSNYKLSSNTKTEKQPYNLATLSLPDLNKVLRSGKEWHGKVVVVNHWATWCPPCQEEIPTLMQFQQDMADKNVAVIGVAHDLLENTIIFADSIGLDYPSLVTIVEGQKILKQQGNKTGALPYTVVFDQQGNLKQTFLGKLTYQKLYEMVSPLLNDMQSEKA